jgi:AraC-like DNA-binding protein
MSNPSAEEGSIRFARSAVDGVLLSRGVRRRGRRRECLPSARFALCTAGNVEVSCRGAGAITSPGVIVLVEAGETVAASVINPSSAWVLDVAPSAVLRAVGHPLHLRAPHVVPGSPLANVLTALVHSITRGETPLDQSVRLVTFLDVVAARHGELDRRAAIPSVPFHVRRVREVIDDRFADTLTLDELADHAGLSPLYLVRAFHSAVGMPPHEYQLNVRVHRARELLVAGRAASEVAIAVGFSDLSHLTRHFKRLIGTPPGEFARAVSRKVETSARGSAASARDVRATT